MAEPKPWRLVLRLIAMLMLLVALSYGADWALRAENFPVQNVRFEGPFRHVTQRDLEDAVIGLVRGNFFLVDLDVVQSRVEALPWVHRVSVRRRFPHDIAITFTEQQLAARWDEDAWVNTDGEVVRVTGDDLPSDLPQLNGPEGTSSEVYAAFREFGTVLAPLDLRLAALSLSPRRSWRLELQTAEGERPLTLVADHEQALARIERFARVYRASLAEQAAAVRQVDLRYTNGFAVQWYPPAARARVAHEAMPGNEG